MQRRGSIERTENAVTHRYARSKERKTDGPTPALAQSTTPFSYLMLMPPGAAVALGAMPSRRRCSLSLQPRNSS